MCINDTDASCHLDHMKRYALNSCEMLIDALNENYPNPNPHNERLKREILENRNSTSVHRKYNFCFKLILRLKLKTHSLNLQCK